MAAAAAAAAAVTGVADVADVVAAGDPVQEGKKSFALIDTNDFRNRLSVAEDFLIGLSERKQILLNFLLLQRKTFLPSFSSSKRSVLHCKTHS